MPYISDVTMIDDHNTDVIHSEIHWKIDPGRKFISGEVTHTIKAIHQKVTTLHFDLNKKLKVIYVSLPTLGMELNFNHTSDGEIEITLPSPLAIGQIIPIKIRYEGAPPSTGLGSFTFDNHAGVPVAWNVSPPFGSMDFWPCKNGLTDKIDSLDIFVTCPKRFKAASNGNLVSETTNDSTYTCHWKHRYPIASYLVGLGVTNYNTFTDTLTLKSGLKLPVLNYVYPESETSARQGMGKLLNTLAFFDSLFVDYPFANEKYGHAQFGFGGGMEHQTMSFVTDYSFGLLAHELAHQWFGNLVTCGDWQDTWLNEGSATFLEGLAQERFNGSSAYFSWKLSKKNSVISTTNGSVKVPSTTSALRIFDGRLTYNKGAMLLHMLRWIMGDEDFFAGMRDFLIDRKYGYASTEDLRFNLEKNWTAQKDLKHFFDSWFEGQGYPIYKLTWQQEGDKLFVKLDQTTSHNSVSFYELPIPIRVKYENGTEIFHRLEHINNGQFFELPTTGTISKIDFDPEIRIVSKSSVVKGSVTNTKEAYSDSWSILPDLCSGNFIRIDGCSEKCYYTLTDIMNRVISSGNLQNLKIYVESLPSGRYFIKIGGQVKSFIKI
jgi:aminopeptidase N